MRDSPLLQEALELAWQISRVNLGVGVGLRTPWHRVAYSSLTVSCKSLLAIHLILSKLGKEATNPAYILVRHMLEVAVRLRYLENGVQNEHPLESMEKLPSMEAMCEKLGLRDHYDEVYGWTSTKVHGKNSAETELSRLFGYTRTSDWEAANVLLASILYYCMAVNVAVRVHPALASSFVDFHEGTHWYARLDTLTHSVKAASSVKWPFTSHDPESR